MRTRHHRVARPAGLSVSQHMCRARCVLDRMAKPMGVNRSALTLLRGSPFIDVGDVPPAGAEHGTPA